MKEVQNYKNKKVLIAGGFGFIGLNLIRSLLGKGSQITILDSKDKIPLQSLIGEVKSVVGGISDLGLVAPLLKENDIFFNLAGRSGPLNSFSDPVADLEINCGGVLNILETAKKINPEIKIIFPGSRLEFGRVKSLPVAEDDPMRPTSLYGIHKLTAEKYHLAYHDNFGLKTTVLRISNLYGPHLPANNPGYNIINYFIDLALKGETIKIFGDGKQIRDQLYIGDLVNLFLEVGANSITDGQVYNVGFGKGTPLIEVAQKIVQIAKKGEVQNIPWDKNYQKLETGDWETDISKVKRDTGWKPQTDLSFGISETIKSFSDPYWKQS